MLGLGGEYTFKIINKVAYIALAILGCYFVYYGNVWNIFWRKRTNFSVHDEPVTEYPTIVSWIQYYPRWIHPYFPYLSRPWLYGKNYSLTCEILGAKEIQLVKGENVIPGTGVKLKLEIKYGSKWDERLKITLLRFPSNIAQERFRFTYTLKNDTSTDLTGILIQFLMATKNNSNCEKGWDHYDGDVRSIKARPGENKWLRIHPEKYIYNTVNGECRDKPYNDLTVERMFERLNKTCRNPCLPQNYWVCNEEMESLIPPCENPNPEKSKEILCFEDTLNWVKGQRKDIPIKPCTKLNYRLEETRLKHAHNKNQLRFEYFFSKPEMVTVREEYIIYDGVALVSIIGGTLGIFIGFSFKELITLLLGYAEMALKCVQRIKKPNNA